MNGIQILMASNVNASVNITEAKDRLRMAFPIEIRFSEAVSSPAINKAGDVLPGRGYYINVLCLAKTSLSIENVVSTLKALEAAMGRIKGSEVVIDLDLVVWNDEVIRPWEVAQTFYQNCLLSINRNQFTEG